VGAAAEIDAALGVAAVGAWLLVADIFLVFIGFFTLVGTITTGIGLSDLISRGQYRQRIEELETRQGELRRRIYESLTNYSTY
jgi:membrane-bound ClpP family serine protease